MPEVTKKFHFNPETGRAGRCYATEKGRGCPFGGSEVHFDTKAEASGAFEKGKPLETKKLIRYSFEKNFQKQQEDFREEFDGVPTRFFNADLEQGTKYIRVVDEEGELQVRISPRDRFRRIATVLSEKSDLTLNQEKLDKISETLGIEKFRPIEGMARHFKGVENTWIMTLRKGELSDLQKRHNVSQTYVDTHLLVVDAPVGSKNFETYKLRYRRDDNVHEFVVVDARFLSGVARATKLTGINPLEAATLNRKSLERTRDAVATAEELTGKLQDLQQKGKNFKAQEKYFRDSAASIASAWEDKKYPDKVHQELMVSSRLNKYFRKIEMDNDVDPEEFEDFTREYEAIRDKLPPIPKDRTPELRVRKLGKHRATGLFVPSKNTVIVDVRTSGSFIHEMAHQYDVTVRNNASLQSEFRDLSKEYAKTVKIPPTAGRDPSYYTIPTEIFARGFEHYAHERLGIKESRLLDEGKFSNFDHLPFQDPELRNRFFSFYDKLLQEK